MSKVGAIMYLSLDGFVGDAADGVADVFDWYAFDEVEIQAGGVIAMTFRMSEASVGQFRDRTSGLGAVLTGRRTFEVADGWSGQPQLGPGVLTHEILDAGRGPIRPSTS